jgi:hypothetical protein
MNFVAAAYADFACYLAGGYGDNAREGNQLCPVFRTANQGKTS